MSEGNANPRARKAHLTQLLLFRVDIPSSDCLQRHQHRRNPSPRVAQTRYLCWQQLVNSLQQPARNPPSQCCKTVLCSPSRDRRTLEGVPRPASSLQHGLPYALRPRSASLRGGRCLELPKRSGRGGGHQGFKVTMQEAPCCLQRCRVPRLHGLQIYSSDQLRQCWTPSRHSLLGTQEQYS